MIIVVVKDSLVESYNVPLFFANAADYIVTGKQIGRAHV